MDNDQVEVNSSENNLTFTRKLILFFVYFYLSSLIYGIILMRNYDWTVNNVFYSIIIYIIIIFVDLILFFATIIFNLCPNFNLRTTNNRSENIWYQNLNVNEISRIISENFLITENIQNNINNQEINLNEIENNSTIIENNLTDIESNNYEIYNNSNIKSISFEINENKFCFICNDEYKKIDDNKIEYVKLNCNHRFCIECIGKWCKEKNTCPLCRLDILNENHLIKNKIKL